MHVRLHLRVAIRQHGLGAHFTDSHLFEVVLNSFHFRVVRSYPKPHQAKRSGQSVDDVNRNVATQLRFFLMVEKHTCTTVVLQSSDNRKCCGELDKEQGR